MIITQTPFRMSFFGGGTDMENFFRKNGGAVLSTTFDKYCYVNVRHLPRFFDYSTELSYSKTERVTCIEQVNGYGKTGDVFLGISTSGNSKNVLYAATTAHAKGMKVIGLTGAKNSKLEQMSDVCIKVPQTETYMIQELHLPVYHCLCLMLEERFFGENN